MKKANTAAKKRVTAKNKTKGRSITKKPSSRLRRFFVSRGAMTLATLAFVLVFGGFGVYLLTASHAATNPKPIWAVSTGNLQGFANYLKDHGKPTTLIDKAFGGSNNYLVGFGSNPDKPVDSAIITGINHVRSFGSFGGKGGLQETLKAKALPGHGAKYYGYTPYDGAVYDNEKWTDTPVNEQKDPITYMTNASKVLHSNNPRLLSINAPGVDLVYASPPAVGGSNPYDAFINRGYAAAAARNADVYVIQAEGTENNRTIFDNFIKAAAQQAHDANPNVKILVDMSTTNAGWHPDYKTFHDEYWDVRSIKYVNGFWISNPDQAYTSLWIDVLQTEYGAYN